MRMNPGMAESLCGDGHKAAFGALCGLVLVALLLSACGSSSSVDAREVVSEGAEQSENVERLGLMRIEAADVASHADWEAWFAEPWQAREDVPATFDAVRFICPEGDCTIHERMEVSSCALLFEADSRDLDVAGMEAPQAGYLYRRQVCYAGRTLAAMRDATTSHVSDYVLEPETLAELPAEMGYPGSADEFEGAHRIDQEGAGLGVFLEQVVGITDASAIQTTDEGLRVEDGNNWTREWLLLGRGDLDRDGIEDLLIGENLYITDEVLRIGSRLHVLTRKEADAPIRVMYQVPVLGKADACSGSARCANFLLPERR